MKSRSGVLGLVFVSILALLVSGVLTRSERLHADDDGATAESVAKTPDKDTSAAPKLSGKTRVIKADYEGEWEELLEQPVSLDAAGLSLADALAQLEAQWKKPLIIHHSVIDVLGSLDGIEVTRNYSGMSGRQTLTLLLESEYLTYSPAEGHLVILTEDEAQNNRGRLKTRNQLNSLAQLLHPEGS